MSQQLWNEILAYDLDAPFAEYSFSMRLASENYWTKEFTALAVLEYKKFMYLAATTDTMVSPSGVIDTVWHQHLIFTRSYEAFCAILGKRVQHVPSTHNKEDFQKFRLAKERTGDLYEEAFGDPPSPIWAFGSMYESLNLAKAKIKIRSFVNGGVLAIVGLSVPFYLLLEPVYARLHNPGFMYTLLIITPLIFVSLEIFNRYTLRKMVEMFSWDCFVYGLRPMELVYLKTQKLESVINGTLNEMVEKGLVSIDKDNRISTGVDNTPYLGKEEAQVIATLKDIGATFYPILLNELKRKPVFSNIAGTMDAFKKYFYKSQKFGYLFYLNFSVIALLILSASTRIVTGMARERPIFEITVFTFVLIILAVSFLSRLTNQLGSDIIPRLYKNHVLPLRPAENNWQWTYFLMGATVLGSSFASIINRQGGNGINDTGSGGSDSSSCGSNCGSSCGGCGGD
jgi:hypothetical protein